jgi:hypothetical protein
MSNASLAHPALAAAWNTYYQTIETARRMMEDTPRFRDFPDTRATLYYSLAEAQAMAYNLAIAPRMDVPLVHTHGWYHYYFTLGGTSPDFYNVFLYLDGRKTYRLSGRFGDLELIVLQGYSHLLGHAESKLLGNFDIGDNQREATRGQRDSDGPELGLQLLLRPPRLARLVPRYGQPRYRDARWAGQQR